ncbi:hypothetical protein P6709_06290 [Jeotgalibacillus sp. ET6]|uniref:hypothetical protein n=1 Tax=Jeotgalibacillus sp. ET6 TaxID=3037260 RepID=UPI00241899C6|nr:hypothetical protein [Jeotgalibacillus sp. ET6]MDG5471349.1 hypothetical protein [Jeotgalibacillus sp. ET6]
MGLKGWAEGLGGGISDVSAPVFPVNRFLTRQTLTVKDTQETRRCSGFRMSFVIAQMN